MKRVIIGFMCVMTFWAPAQMYPPPSTPYTRYFMLATNSEDALLRLGLGTNAATLTSIIITNNAYFLTNVWAGPSAPWPLDKARLYYDTTENVTITGITGKSNNVPSSSLLTLRNRGVASVTVTLPAGFKPRDALTFTLTNGTTVKISGEYDPAMPETNQVTRHFGP